MDLQNWLNNVQSQKARPAVMGILNVTPDSFSDGGKLRHTNDLEKTVEQMMRAGVDMFDIGGESTRPGAEVVGLQQELDRVLPAIQTVRAMSDLPISIDTYKPEVMDAAIQNGANLINDVNALQADGAIEIAVKYGVPVCLMHKKGIPKTMQDSVLYQNVVQEVTDFLLLRAKLCEEAGLDKNQIMLDPGFGFGKYLEHNIQLFQSLKALSENGYPVLVGVSRKRMIAELLGHSAEVDVLQRVQGSVAAAIVAALNGAKVLRVHDVKETVESLNVAMVLWNR